jgi:beta-glucosidase
VSFSLKNTGTRTGAEVAQVYVGDPSTAGEPPKQLKSYRKVLLEPGQAQTVSLSLDPRSFAVWDTGRHAWVVPGGKYTVSIGSSSRDVRLSAPVSVPRRVLGP